MKNQFGTVETRINISSNPVRYDGEAKLLNDNSQENQKAKWNKISKICKLWVSQTFSDFFQGPVNLFSQAVNFVRICECEGSSSSFSVEILLKHVCTTKSDSTFFKRSQTRHNFIK